MSGSAFLQYLRRVQQYLDDCEKGDPLFAPEAAAMREVLGIVGSGGSQCQSMTEVIRVVNGVSETEHYGGSAWKDAMSQILEACRALGMNASLEESGKGIII